MFINKTGFLMNLEKFILSQSACNDCYSGIVIHTRLYYQKFQKLEHRLVLVDHDNRVNSSLTCKV
uniref:Uncharacterized protein n=1 Tax=Timema poppense TaxID=170557 RepID=A0A7R9HHG2_TIMPO|nr:unnamed protein product [Timema poppensis]